MDRLVEQEEFRMLRFLFLIVLVLGILFCAVWITACTRNTAFLGGAKHVSGFALDRV